jgi:subtilisin family serine protease
MAAPVVSGVAALLMAYYPELSAEQVRQIILDSATRYPGLRVIRPGSESARVPFSDLSATGGIVNAYEAVRLAEERSRH